VTHYICHTQPTHQVTDFLLGSVTGPTLEFRFQQDRQCIYNVTFRCSCNCCCSGEAISTTYSECVSIVLVIQHAMHMPPLSVASLALLYFCASSRKRHNLKKKTLLNTKCVLNFFYNFHLKYFSF